MFPFCIFVFFFFNSPKNLKFCLSNKYLLNKHYRIGLKFQWKVNLNAEWINNYFFWIFYFLLLLIVKQTSPAMPHHITHLLIFLSKDKWTNKKMKLSIKPSILLSTSFHLLVKEKKKCMRKTRLVITVHSFNEQFEWSRGERKKEEEPIIIKKNRNEFKFTGVMTK